MGKPSPQSQVVNDLEERRRVMRELNEATKDARAAMRELTAARQELNELVRNKFAELCSTYLALSREAIAEEARKLQDQVNQASDRIAASNARLLGMQSSEELVKLIAEEMVQLLMPGFEMLISTMTEDWLRAHVAEVARNGNLIRFDKPNFTVDEL